MRKKFSKIFFSIDKDNLIKRQVFLFCALLLVFGSGYLILKWWIGMENKKLSEQIVAQIEYENGNWQIEKFLNDEEISNQEVIYIFSNNGFVVTRQNWIKGFLDVSDYSFSSSFFNPQTITSPVGINYRMLSQPIWDESEVVGILSLGYIQPEFLSTYEIDGMLRKESGEIILKIKVSENGIDLSNLDIRDINYKIGVEIIDKNNQVLMSRANIPAYIDRSYLANLRLTDNLEVKEKDGFRRFWLRSERLVKDGLAIGYIVVGKEIGRNFRYLGYGFLGFLLIGQGIILIFSFGEKFSKKSNSRYKKVVKKNKIVELKFDAVHSEIIFGDKKVKIPMETNQYYLCKRLFLKRAKVWEADEIVEAVFGEVDFDKVKKYFRKVYDAARGVNEKTKKDLGIEIIKLEAKRVRLENEN